MTTAPANEKGHFLNEKQKELKQKIMEDALSAIFDNIKDNIILFDDLQQLLDLHFSILVMLNREVLTHIFKSSGAIKQRGKIMRNMFDAIQKEVNVKIKENKSQ